MKRDRVLFVGLGKSAVCWYRCALPATFLSRAGWKADWIGLAGEPPTMLMQTGLCRGNTAFPDFSDYDIVVLQQPRGTGWLRVIKRLQSEGVKVLFEVDDYLHAIRKMKDHDYSQHFGKEQLERLELNMRVCDGIICSTEYIGRRYRAFNENVYVCRNGVDLARYNLTRPPRPSVNVGWSGATGHTEAVLPWVIATGNLMAQNERICFVTIGQNFADSLKPHFPTRCISIPFTLIDTYPSAMTMFDVALAPAGKGGFFRGKSDLRWLEAGALGVPIIADPIVYPDIKHGETGFHAGTANDAGEILREVVNDDRLRTTVGTNVRDHIRQTRGMEVACLAWAEVFDEVLEQAEVIS